MNNKGQFLLYDILLSILILLILLVSITYIEENNEHYQINYDNYTQSYTMLDIIENKNLLSKLSVDTTNNTLNTIDDIIKNSYDTYTLTDESLNMTLIDKKPNKYKKVIVGRKIVNNHIYTLTVYD